MLLGWGVLLSPPLAAQIYQCSDPDTGNRTFSDKDCPDRSIGNTIEMDRTNSSTPFASDAEIVANEKRRAIKRSKFRDAWQAQNRDAQAAVEEKERQRKAKARERERESNEWNARRRSNAYWGETEKSRNH